MVILLYLCSLRMCNSIAQYTYTRAHYIHTCTHCTHVHTLHTCTHCTHTCTHYNALAHIAHTHAHITCTLEYVHTPHAFTRAHITHVCTTHHAHTYNTTHIHMTHIHTRIVIQALVALVHDPEPEHPLRGDLAEEYTRNRDKFLKNAEDFTKKYAEKRPAD